MPTAAECQGKIDETSQDLRIGRLAPCVEPVTIKMITRPSNFHRFHSNSADSRRLRWKGGKKKHDIFLIYTTLGGLNGSKTTFVVGSVRFDPVTVIEAIEAGRSTSETG